MSNENKSRLEKWKSAMKAREYVLGNHQHTPDDVNKHTGLIQDKEVRKLLSLMQMYYHPDKSDIDVDRFENTQFYRKAVKKYGTESLTNSIYENNPIVQSYFVGEPGENNNVSGLNAIDDLISLMEGEAPIIYIWGPPNAGKTDFGCLLSQIWKRYHHPEGEIASNIRTMEEKDHWINKWSKLKDWLNDNLEVTFEDGQKATQKKEGAKEKLYFFDEGSTGINSSGESGYESRSKLMPMVFQIRKAGGGLIVVGHDGKSVGPAMRALAKCIRKYRDNKKKARVFDDVENRKGYNEYSFSPITGIPASDWDSYNDKELVEFHFDDEDNKMGDIESVEKETIQEKGKEIADEIVSEKLDKLMALLAIETGPSVRQSDIAQAFNVDPSTVSRKKSEYESEIAGRKADEIV